MAHAATAALAGGCSASLCTPVVVAMGPEPADLVLAGGNLYWDDFPGGSTTIFEVPAMGGQVETLANIPGGVNQLAVTGSIVWAMTPSDLYRIDTAAKTSAIFYTPPMGLGLESIAATATTVFIVEAPDPDTAEIVALDVATLTTSPVSTDVDPDFGALPLWQGQPVWIDTALGVSTVINGVAKEIATIPHEVNSVTADDQFVWATSGLGTGTVTRVDPTTGATVTAPGPSDSASLAAFGSTLVWVDNAEIDEWDGTTVTKIAANFDSLALTVDATEVYGILDGTVVRVAR